MTNEITRYRNTETGATAPAHCTGTDEDGDRVYSVPEGWEPVEPYWLDEDGLAHARVNRYENESDNEIWEGLVGDQSRSEFVDNCEGPLEEAVHEYVRSAPTCADLTDEERETAAAAMLRHIEVA